MLMNTKKRLPSSSLALCTISETVNLKKRMILTVTKVNANANHSIEMISIISRCWLKMHTKVRKAQKG